jgi:hypothetical protein
MSPKGVDARDAGSQPDALGFLVPGLPNPLQRFAQVRDGTRRRYRRVSTRARVVGPVRSPSASARFRFGAAIIYFRFHTDPFHKCTVISDMKVFPFNGQPGVLQ